MKVFISWSGERSRRVAELLRTWVECVIQAVEPWVSSSDIDRGSLWFTQIIDELSTTTHGIICLTRDNKEKPWILFDAGALAKGLGSSRIYTLLVDLNPEDIRDPLAQFNHTRPTEGEIFKLVSSINKGLEGKGLKEGVLRSAFATYWPQFESEFKKIIEETEVTAAPIVERKPEDVLSEILNTVRGLDRRVRTVESSVSSNTSPISASVGRDSIVKSAITMPNGTLVFKRKKLEPMTDLKVQTIWKAIQGGLSDKEILDVLTDAESLDDETHALDMIANMRRSG
jgi:hypothetical protein